ncbi:hypothetical protein FRC03_002346 [Tulasnella sp. 419]|nr:hypothetical protein FRC03_002346 [Tulasnella sp. 419]
MSSIISSDPSCIFDTLSQLPLRPLPATEVINYLIRSLAQEACEQHYTSCVQTYYRIVNRARDICVQLNQQIRDVDSSQDKNEYNLYISQIEPLERLLFEVSDFIYGESHRNPVPRDNPIQGYLDRFERWIYQREIYRNICIKLHSPPFALPEYDWEVDLRGATNYDDLAWISIICDMIASSLANLVSEYLGDLTRLLHITAVIRVLAEIHTILEENDNYDESRIILVIRCFVVIHGIIAIASDPNTDKAVRKHLLSRITWASILRFVEKLRIALWNLSLSIDILVDEWANFEGYIVNERPAPQDVDQLLELLLLYPPRVRRPYYTQSLALVELCFNLGRRVKDSDVSYDIEKLENAVEFTIQAMELCASVSTQITQFDWENLRTNDAGKAIKEAIKWVHICYKEFQMNVEDVNSIITKAHNQDKNIVNLLSGHINRLQVLRKPVDQERCLCGETIQVRINISERGDNYLDSTTRKALSLPSCPFIYAFVSIDSMKSGGGLNSILWNLTKPLSSTQRTGIIHRPRFYAPDGAENSQELLRHEQVQNNSEISVVCKSKDRPFRSKLMAFFS